MSADPQRTTPNSALTDLFKRVRGLERRSYDPRRFQTYPTMIHCQVEAGALYSPGAWQWVLDTDPPDPAFNQIAPANGSGYLFTNSFMDIDGDLFYLVNIGPRFSAWTFLLWNVRIGGVASGFGQQGFSCTSDLEISMAGPYYPGYGIWADGRPRGPTNVPSGDWVFCLSQDLSNSGGLGAYGIASPPFTGLPELTITGDYGDQMTSYDGFDRGNIDGGPGYYWVRFDPGPGDQGSSGMPTNVLLFDDVWCCLLLEV